MMIRACLALALALLLALTSQSMAVARGAAAATGQMVLCTGAGPVAVYTDAQGNPTSAPHICPDSALNVTVSGPPVIAAAPLRLVFFQPATRLAQLPLHHAPRRGPRPRAPPSNV